LTKSVTVLMSALARALLSVTAAAALIILLYTLHHTHTHTHTHTHRHKLTRATSRLYYLHTACPKGHSCRHSKTFAGMILDNCQTPKSWCIACTWRKTDANRWSAPGSLQQTARWTRTHRAVYTETR